MQSWILVALAIPIVLVVLTWLMGLRYICLLYTSPSPRD